MRTLLPWFLACVLGWSVELGWTAEAPFSLFEGESGVPLLAYDWASHGLYEIVMVRDAEFGMIPGRFERVEHPQIFLAHWLSRVGYLPVNPEKKPTDLDGLPKRMLSRVIYSLEGGTTLQIAQFENIPNPVYSVWSKAGKLIKELPLPRDLRLSPQISILDPESLDSQWLAEDLKNGERLVGCDASLTTRMIVQLPVK